MDLNAVTTKYWGKYETYSNYGLNSAYQIHLPVPLEDYGLNQVPSKLLYICQGTPGNHN